MKLPPGGSEVGTVTKCALPSGEKILHTAPGAMAVGTLMTIVIQSSNDELSDGKGCSSSCSDLRVVLPVNSSAPSGSCLLLSPSVGSAAPHPPLDGSLALHLFPRSCKRSRGIRS